MLEQNHYFDKSEYPVTGSISKQDADISLAKLINDFTRQKLTHSADSSEVYSSNKS